MTSTATTSNTDTGTQLNRRVVVTGLGVLAPNGHGVDQFETALRLGQSGIRYVEKLKELNFRCLVGGSPQNVDVVKSNYFTAEDLLAMNDTMIYACIAAVDAWKDAGFVLPERSGSEVNWDCGCCIGSGLPGMETIGAFLIPGVDGGKVRRLGSTMVEQVMASSMSAKLSGLLALGNQVTTNSAACSTATEAIYNSYLRIKSGLADRMLAGGVESSSPYIWGGFDAMRVTNGGADIEHPEKASRPMSQSAAGFVPGSGSGVLLLESLESARARKARIYAEIAGGYVNCGGHRNGGSMTFPNPESVVRCIRGALSEAGIVPQQIDTINGHLTATIGDAAEIKNWASALECTSSKLPLINSTKSLIGHCLGAAGSIESVGAVLQVYKDFVHGSLNCEDLHEKIKPYEASVPHKTVDHKVNYLAKASFGFGDVNSCLIFKKFNPSE